MSQNVLVVGADGFIGSRTVRALVNAGHRVITFGPAMSLDLLADLDGQIDRRIGSIEDGDTVAALFRSVRPDLVLSFAAHGERKLGLLRSSELAADRALGVNVVGFRTLLEASVDANVHRVVWASSTTVFGPAALYSAVPVHENAERRPTTIYGLTKLLAEQIGEFYRDRHGLEVVAVRMPLIFGPGHWYGGAAQVMTDLIESAIAHLPFTATLDTETFDLMYSDDVAAAFLALAEYEGELAACYHINGFATSYREIVAALVDLRPSFAPHVSYEAGGATYPLIAATRIERDIGFVARHDLVTGLSHSLEAITTLHNHD